MSRIAIIVAVVACVNVVTPASVGDCVRNNANTIFGVVTVVGDTGVVIYDGVTRRFLQNSDVVNAADSNCDDAFRGGQCACTLRETQGYELKDGNANPLQIIQAGACYEILTPPAGTDLTPVTGKDLVKISSTLGLFLSRTDIGVDPTKASCSSASSAAYCTDNVVSDSAKCDAVFVQNVPDQMISKGQFRDRCVYGINDNLKYAEARTFCEDNNMKLVWVENDDTAKKVYEATGQKQFWVGLEKTSGGVWQWVSPDGVVDATSDVSQRWKGANDATVFERAIVQGSNSQFPLKGMSVSASKKAVCEEQVTCTGYKTTAATLTISLISTTLATLLLVL